MRLVSARIENFRCVEDSGEFGLGPLVCLVGKNESGKTSILQALYKLNAVLPENGSFDEVQDYPRSALSEYQEEVRAGRRPKAAVLTTKWELSDDEVVELEAALGKGTVTSRAVVVKRGYDNTQHWTVSLDEPKVVSTIVSGLFEEERSSLKGIGTVRELADALKADEGGSEQRNQLLNHVLTQFPELSAQQYAVRVLSGRMPKCVYFADYQKMPGQISVESLISRKAHNQLQPNEHIFLALLDLAGTSLEEIRDIGRAEAFIAKLEAVSNRISREVFTYWSQNRHLEVQIVMDQGRRDDPPPFNSGSVFRTRIRNNRHGVTVSFDDRSSGFVWFFSFLVWFSQLRKHYGDNLVVLLDEPGLSLHARAQSDLLRYIKERLVPNYQVIYTTHSPFLVDVDELLGVRTVEDVVVDDQPKGTKVGDKVLSTDADTLFPLQGALGYDITQTLFVGKNTLLVEGPSDFLYIRWLSKHLQSQGRVGLDRRWTVAPVGGLSKISSFVTLFRGTQLNVAALIDVQRGQKQKTRDLLESELLKKGHILLTSTYAGQDEADIEDMLGRELYCCIVNQCYGLTGKKALPAAKPKGAPFRVLEEVEDHLRLIPELPEFDHYTPAQFFIENAGGLAEGPSFADAAARFERLFGDLNEML